MRKNKPFTSSTVRLNAVSVTFEHSGIEKEEDSIYLFIQIMAHMG